MKHINHSNIILALSFVFLIFASAFTLIPDSELENSTITSTSCKTCELAGTGQPIGCKDAQFCGQLTCENSCDLSGRLCGECAEPEENWDNKINVSSLKKRAHILILKN